MSQVEKVLYSTVDPLGVLPSCPALTTLLYRVCEQNTPKFEEATRLLELFIQKALSTVSEEYVTPTALAVKAGWDDPERFEWPAKVVHRFTTKTEKNVVQFLLKDRRDGGFLLKTWDERYLEAVKREAP